MHGVNSDGSMSESCKWYDHEDSMRAISEAFHNVLFTLHGEGEEAGDIWDKYFLNGKMQACKAKVVIEPFDEKQLK